MINRQLGQHVIGVAVEQRVYTCSTGDVASAADINGRVIDRLGLGGNRIFENVSVGVAVYTTVGSTAADKRITLGVRLQHGDSSAGGDMADYSTGSQSVDKNFFTTAESTAYQNWSTGVTHLSHQSWYNVIAAKRYVRPVGVVTRGGSTTSTAASSIDILNATLSLWFNTPDYGPPSLSTSTSTSTST